MQRVIRPDQDFRGYAGQVVSGTVRPGDGILALPSGRRSRVKSIETFDGQLEEAVAPMSVTLTLEDEVDISRGDMLASAQKPPEAARQFDASMVWLNEQPLDLTPALCVEAHHADAARGSEGGAASRQHQDAGTRSRRSVWR